MKWYVKLLIIAANSLLACSLAYAINYTHPQNTHIAQHNKPI